MELFIIHILAVALVALCTFRLGEITQKEKNDKEYNDLVEEYNTLSSEYKKVKEKKNRATALIAKLKSDFRNAQNEVDQQKCYIDKMHNDFGKLLNKKNRYKKKLDEIRNLLYGYDKEDEN